MVPTHGIQQCHEISTSLPTCLHRNLLLERSMHRALGGSSDLYSITGIRKWLGESSALHEVENWAKYASVVSLSVDRVPVASNLVC